MKNELASPMKCSIELNDMEKRTLQELALRHPYEDFRVRGQGLLLLGAGQRVHEIATQLDVSKKTVYNWMNAWREKGLCGLQDILDRWLFEHRNLIEVVWKHAKYHWRRFVTWTKKPSIPR